MWAEHFEGLARRRARKPAQGARLKYCWEASGFLLWPKQNHFFLPLAMTVDRAPPSICGFTSSTASSVVSGYPGPVPSFKGSPPNHRTTHCVCPLTQAADGSPGEVGHILQEHYKSMLVGLRAGKCLLRISLGEPHPWGKLLPSPASP